MLIVIVNLAAAVNNVILVRSVEGVIAVVNTAQFSSMSYDAAKPRITQYLTGEMRKQKYQEALAALKTEYIVEVLTPDTTDAAED